MDRHPGRYVAHADASTQRALGGRDLVMVLWSQDSRRAAQACVAVRRIGMTVKLGEWIPE